MREEDATSIVDLLNPLIEAGEFTVMDQPVSVADQLTFIRNFPDRGVFNVAAREGDGDILGLQDVVPTRREESALAHVGEISTFVRLGCHRQGVGRALTLATLETIREHEIRKVMATVRADNPRAIAFYQSQGFAIIGTARRHARVRGRYVDEVLMEHFLEPEVG